MANGATMTSGASTDPQIPHALPSSTSIQYYSGTASYTWPPHTPGGASTVTSAPYLDQRTIDQAAGTITESVVNLGVNGKFKVNTSVMTIHGNTFTMTESTGSVTGAGTFTGNPWAWTFMRGEFIYTAPDGKTAKIHDVNFLAAPGMLIAHDDFESPSGDITMQEDLQLAAVDQATFESLKAHLLTPLTQQ